MSYNSCFGSSFICFVKFSKLSVSKIQNVLRGYRNNILNESGYTQIKENLGANKIISQLIKESEELNRK